jgi:hypothetical protein
LIKSLNYHLFFATLPLQFQWGCLKIDLMNKQGRKERRVLSFSIINESSYAFDNGKEIKFNVFDDSGMSKMPINIMRKEVKMNAFQGRC